MLASVQSLAVYSRTLLARSGASDFVSVHPAICSAAYLNMKRGRQTDAIL